MKLIFALALGVLSTTVHAEAVTYNFSGTFDSPRSGQALAGLVNGGDHFSGQFTFDTAAPWIDQLAFRGANAYFYDVQAFTLKASDAFNNAVPAWNAPTDMMYNQANGANISIGNYAGVGGPPWEPAPVTNSFRVTAGAITEGNRYNWTISLAGDSSTTSFEDGRIPVGFNDIVNPTFSLRVYDTQAMQWSTVDGTVQIQYASVSPVPEPSSALMLVAGLAGVGGIAALRRRRA